MGLRPAGLALFPHPSKHHHNLPLQPQSLIGRDRELASAEQRLLDQGVRLLTLTGPAGVGKTHLAVVVAAHLIDAFAGDVDFVDLAPVRDPRLVLPAIAQALKVPDTGPALLMGRLQDSLQDKRHLLVLDNFEQVIEAATLLGELLAACPAVQILVTSREPLHLRWEHQLAVPPLGLPPSGTRRQGTEGRDERDDGESPQSPAELLQYEAVVLFVERARTVRSDFALTPENAADVAGICIRLDGLPLAIELAAARSKLLAPQPLLGRLERRLALLTGGARDRPARHQALRTAIDWSYDLLSEAEQRLFRRLAVFVGGCTLDASAAVECRGSGVEDGSTSAGDPPGIGEPVTPATDTSRPSAGSPDELGRTPAPRPPTLAAAAPETLDVVAALLNKSLLSRDEREENRPRFRMLETIREYALEILRASGELHEAERCHAEYFLALAEQAQQAFQRSDRGVWLERLDREHDNLRAALHWLQQQHEADLGLRLATAVSHLWFYRGYLAEGRAWLEQMLALGEESPASLRSAALAWSGHLARRQGDYAAARHAFEQSLPLARVLEDRHQIAEILSNLGLVAHSQGDYRAARPLLEESIALGRQGGDPRGLAFALGRLGHVLCALGEYGSAQERYQESLEICRAGGDRQGCAMWLGALGDAARGRGDYAAAQTLLEASLAMHRELGNSWGRATATEYLAEVAYARGDYAAALPLLDEALAYWRASSDQWNLGVTLARLGAVAREQGDRRRAIVLLRESITVRVVIDDRPGIAHSLLEMAGVLVALGRPEPAARLLAAAEALRTDVGAALPAPDLRDSERFLARLQAELPADSLAAAWTEGVAMPPEEAVAAAVAVAPDTGLAMESAGNYAAELSPAPAQRDAYGLSRRELEVLRLVAAGMSTRALAAALVISERTVANHLSHIFTKLGVESRAAAAALARRHGLD
jgi:predicted ATPase/DNA-binding CsgD family transcriptional regulator